MGIQEDKIEVNRRVAGSLVEAIVAGREAQDALALVNIYWFPLNQAKAKLELEMRRVFEQHCDAQGVPQKRRIFSVIDGGAQ